MVVYTPQIIVIMVAAAIIVTMMLNEALPVYNMTMLYKNASDNDNNNREMGGQRLQ